MRSVIGEATWRMKMKDITTLKKIGWVRIQETHEGSARQWSWVIIMLPKKLRLTLSTLTELAAEATYFGSIEPFCRSESFKVTDFGTNGKPVGLCDFQLLNNGNVCPISHLSFKISRSVGQNFPVDRGASL